MKAANEVLTHISVFILEKIVLDYFRVACALVSVQAAGQQKDGGKGSGFTVVIFL